MKFRSLALIVIAAVAFTPQISWSHPMPSSTVFLDIYETGVKAEINIPLSELGLALGENLRGDPQRIVATYGSQFASYFPRHIRPTTPDGRAWTVQVDGFSVSNTEQALTGPYQELSVQLTLTPPVDALTNRFTLNYDVVMHQVSTHFAAVSVRQDWMNGIVPDNPVQVGVIRMNPKDGTIAPLLVDNSGSNLLTGFMNMVQQGMSHIANGTDHLLFLLTLLLPAPLIATLGRWSGYAGVRPALSKIVKITTAFTIGHSSTLVLGSIMHIQLPQQPIEVLIALSILVSAIHVLRPIFPKREMYIAGGFGLIHGMAFSFTLSHLQLNPSQMAVSLFGFNAGIEIMQLFIIVLTMPFFLMLARTTAYAIFRLAIGTIAATAALGWLGYANPLADLLSILNSYGLWVAGALATSAIIWILLAYGSKKATLISPAEDLLEQLHILSLIRRRS